MTITAAKPSNVRRPLLVLFWALAIVIGGATLAWACSPQAGFELQPAAGAPLAEFTAEGYGFTPGTPVEVRWDSATGPLLATATGPSFSVAVTVPADASSEVHYVVAVAADGMQRGVFNVTSTESESGDAGSEGASGQVSGGESSTSGEASGSESSTSGGESTDQAAGGGETAGADGSVEGDPATSEGNTSSSTSESPATTSSSATGGAETDAATTPATAADTNAEAAPATADTTTPNAAVAATPTTTTPETSPVTTASTEIAPDVALGAAPVPNTLTALQAAGTAGQWTAELAADAPAEAPAVSDSTVAADLWSGFVTPESSVTSGGDFGAVAGPAEDSSMAALGAGLVASGMLGLFGLMAAGAVRRRREADADTSN